MWSHEKDTISEIGGIIIPGQIADVGVIAVLPEGFIETNGVYFYYDTVDEFFKPTTRHYASTCLATGLKRLQIPIFSNFESPLFEQKPLEQLGNHLYVVDITQESDTPDLLEGLLYFPVDYKAIIAMTDGNDTVFTPPEIPCFITHENKFLKITGDRIPWAFGLSDERLQATENGMEFGDRKNILLRNFRPSHAQSVRDALDLALIPHLEKYFEIDWALSENHFDKLKTYKGCLAYCGNFNSNLARNPFFAQLESYQASLQNRTFLKEPVVCRWDNWRFWESLAAGCLTFHLDFEKYGMLLPVMPEGWKHYIPIDLEDCKGTVERLMDERDRLGEIALNRKTWARTHYSPEAVAHRLIDYLTHHRR